MKQKLAVARALLHRPKLIFLDEPTAGLDPVAAATLREDLANLVSRGDTTVFLTTHNLTDAERLCRQVAVIRQGKLLAVGSLEELRSKSNRAGSVQSEIYGRGFTPELISQLTARPEVFSARHNGDHLIIELAKDAEMGPVVSQIAASGASIEEIRKGKASLEDIFLELVDDKTEE